VVNDHLSRRKLAARVATLGLHPTPNQITELTDISTAIRRRISAWRSTEEEHIPGVSRLHEQGSVRDATVTPGPMDAFNSMLWLPLEIVSQVPCDEHLLICEWELRKAQADDALESIRVCLLIHAAVRIMKLEYTQGVKEGTRSEVKLRESMKKAHFHADTYRTARKAMIALAAFLPDSRTGEYLKNFPELNRGDVRGLPSGELELGDGYTHVEISWIWKSYGSAAEDKEAINDCMSVILSDYTFSLVLFSLVSGSHTMA
jgi:hypothetical protein